MSCLLGCSRAGLISLCGHFARNVLAPSVAPYDILDSGSQVLGCSSDFYAYFGRALNSVTSGIRRVTRDRHAALARAARRLLSALVHPTSSILSRARQLHHHNAQQTSPCPGSPPSRPLRLVVVVGALRVRRVFALKCRPTSS